MGAAVIWRNAVELEHMGIFFVTAAALLYAGRNEDARIPEECAHEHEELSVRSVYVTPKGVQPPALCDASATREGL